MALIKGLPAEAAIFAENRPGWTQEHELLATQAERNEQWLQIVAGLLVKLGTGQFFDFGPVHRLEHPDRPEPKPAEEEEGEAERETDANAIFAFFFGDPTR